LARIHAAPNPPLIPRPRVRCQSESRWRSSHRRSGVTRPIEANQAHRARTTAPPPLTPGQKLHVPDRTARRFRCLDDFLKKKICKISRRHLQQSDLTESPVAVFQIPEFGDFPCDQKETRPMGRGRFSETYVTAATAGTKLPDLHVI